MSRELPILTESEIITLIEKKLRFKCSEMSTGRYEVKRLNSLRRLVRYLEVPQFKEKYSNKRPILNKGRIHYWVDFWTNDTLITITWSIPNDKI